MYPEAANGEEGTKSLRAPYFSVSVQFVPETRITVEETSITCKSREMSDSHSSMAPLEMDAQTVQVTVCA